MLIYAIHDLRGLYSATFQEGANIYSKVRSYYGSAKALRVPYLIRS